MKNNITVYNSGLKLIHKKMEGIKSVAIGILVGVGSANESLETNGLSHFAEHMFFKGTQTRNAFDISAAIDSYGAQINAFTSKQTTCFYTISTRDQANNCADVLSDILFNSTFDKTELDREKGVVLEEISISEDDPSDICLENLASAFYKGSSLEHTILGPKKNIKSFNRDGLIDYINKHYSAKNIVISIVGDIDFQEANAIILKYFEGNFKSFDFDWQDKPHITTSKYITKFKDFEQSHIALGFPSYEFSNKMIPALNLVNIVLGGGMSSRLFQNIREKQGLAYSVYSYPSTYINNGILTVYVGTSPESVLQATNILKIELNNLIKDGITKEEFERGKQQLKGAFVLGQESSSALMRVHAKYALFANEVFDLDEHINSIENIKYEDTFKVISDIFDMDKISVSYSGKKIKDNLFNAMKD